MLIIVCIVLFIAMFFIYRADFVYTNYRIIIDAIYHYRVDCIMRGIEPIVDYDDLVSFNITILRFWDWKYENLLSEDKYEAIKPYIFM